jgi:hypothetical protein
MRKGYEIFRDILGDLGISRSYIGRLIRPGLSLFMERVLFVYV